MPFGLLYIYEKKTSGIKGYEVNAFWLTVLFQDELTFLQKEYYVLKFRHMKNNLELYVNSILRLRHLFSRNF